MKRLRYSSLLLLLLTIPMASACVSDNSQDGKNVYYIPAPENLIKVPPEAVTSDSGLRSLILEKATENENNNNPVDEDLVIVEYTAWNVEGEMIDSSKARHKSEQFPVADVIPGFQEGLKLMKIGEKRRLWIPADLAYGNPSTVAGAPAGDLVYDVKLLKIDDALHPPEDLLFPDTGFKTTESSLRYRVLTAGNGKKPISEKSRVRVHYSGWDKSGKLFDSSVKRGIAAEFSLSGVIKGWTEGVQLMHEGEKMRFWIPADLAYGEVPSRPGAPSGDLIFDIELIKVLD